MQHPTMISSVSGSLRQLFSHPRVIQVELAVRRWAGQLIFALGLLIYLCAQVGLVLVPNLNRSVPVEADDGYVYVLKAVEMQSCFWQDCPALEDLRSQLLMPSTDSQIEWLRYREYGRAFLTYDPLHAGLLLGLHSFGLSWEEAFDVLIVAGAIFIGLAIGYWLLVMWGFGPAGIALGLLAFNVFPGQGLHYVVPTNLALGIAMLTWAAILRRGSATRWVVLGGIVAMIAMHPTGRLYAIVTSMAYLLLASRPLSRRTWLIAGVGLLIVAVSFGLPLVVSRPVLSIQPDPYPEDWESWRGLWNNLDRARDIVRGWLDAYGGYLIVGLLLSVGFLSTSPQQRRKVMVMGGLLIALLAGSLLYVLPRYPAETFARVWIAVAISLTGAIGQAAWSWINVMLGWLWRIIREGLAEVSSSEWILSARGWAFALLIIIGLVLGRNGVYKVIGGARSLKRSADKMTTIQQIALDPAQPAILLSRGCEAVLYMAEVPMHFFFSRGTLQCGAVYYPALAGTPEEEIWVNNNENVRYVIAWNPIQYLPIAREGALSLVPGERLEFHSPSARPLTSVYFYLENLGEEAILALHLPDTTESIDQVAVQLRVPAKWSGWLRSTTQDELIANAFNLEVLRASGRINLKGLRVNRDSSLNWPWDQGITLAYVPSDADIEPKTIRFESTELHPCLNRSIRTLADSGSTVLAEIGY